MGDYVLTCKQGDNSDLFPDILKLYVKKPALILDMTFGNGVFWKHVDHSGMVPGKQAGRGYSVVGNDLDPERGNYHYDFRHTPFANDYFDAVVLDPPYLYTGGFETLKDSIDKGYKNKDRNRNGINGVKAVDEMYFYGMVEARRLLKVKGKLIVKCQDQVMSGKQVWAHITYMNYAEQLLFTNVDLFVLMQKNQPLMRHKPEQQKHARRNHSYFLVFEK